MNKQEVLEKIILYVTKRKAEDFYTIKKDKYYINISAIENSFRRHSFTENDEYDVSIKFLCEEYKLKRITFKDFKSELEQLLQNISVDRDRKISNIKTIVEKKKFIESEIKNLIESVQKNFNANGLSIKDTSFEWFFSDYEKFVIKSSPINISIDDYICHPNHLKYIVEQNLEECKKHILEKHEKKEKSYNELKQLFLSVSKEELFIPLEDWWSMKLKLDVLYYVPPAKNEQKVLSFFYVNDHLRVNYSMKIDAYLHQTLQTFSTNYFEYAIDEFREYYKSIFGDLQLRPNFLQKVKTYLSWGMYRNLFMNICITSNIFLFGELLRMWTKNSVFYPHKNYKLEKKYPSFIDADITNQKILSGLETQKHLDDLLSSILSFDNKDELDSCFLEKNQNVIKILFDSVSN